MPTCPVCSSEMVYPLLNTLRCKRCKHIWKIGEEEYSTCRCPDLVPSLRTRKKTDPLEIRLEKKLEELLDRHEGKFCITTMTCRYGDTSFELFRSYLRQCVRDRTLAETKDRNGRTWYSREG
jgi:hypothetical protein